MLLKKLIKGCPKNLQNFRIKGIISDSRKIKKDFLFFALKGKNFDGEKFVKIAFKKGAVACVVSKKFKSKDKILQLIRSNNVSKLLKDVCKKFYKATPKNIFAVTGTNGKSSVADFFRQILLINKKTVATIGTLGVKMNNLSKKLNLTSPDLITTNHFLSLIRKKNINNVMIETSSHGLHQGRCDGINFRSGIFTNLSQDHLDYHKNMKNYFQAKMILFKKLLKKNKTVIIDKDIKQYKEIKKISQRRNLKIIESNKTLKILKNNKKRLKIFGNFQLKNLSIAIEAAKLCGIGSKKIFKNLDKIRSVEGRLCLIRKLKNQARIFVDFAHTPNALDVMLKDLKEEFPGSVFSVVFGCGGERDTKKRKLMAQIVEKHCDKIYITDDNPRGESPKNIRKDIITGFKKNNFFEIGNRKLAIKTAIHNSIQDEIIIIAGKGHENTQDYGKKIYKISDKQIINSVKNSFKDNTKRKTDENFAKKVFQISTKKKLPFKFDGISIDSKNVKKNNIFVAIKGKKRDGHNYTKDAIKNGASFCVVTKKQNINRCFTFKNSNQFLKKFAKNNRMFSKAKIIGVTGSTGKTSLKNLLGETLNLYKSTYFSPKSYNNQYGVPLSLSNLKFSNKFGIFEIGMSKKGEINNLAKLVTPDLGIITNVGEAHIENFKNVHGIARAKSEIINNIKKNGTLILKRDDIFFNFFKKKAKKRGLHLVTFGFSKNADVFPISQRRIGNLMIYKVKSFDKEYSFQTQNIRIENILATMAVLEVLKLDLDKFLKSIKLFSLPAGRGKFHKVKRYNKTFNLIDESYNSNPQSLKRAIINFSKLKIPVNKKKYFLMGDMLELGKKTKDYHTQISDVINKTNIDKLFVLGNYSFYTYKHLKSFKRGNILQSGQDFDEIFSNIIEKGDFLMIKGSNAIGLNVITNNIIQGKKNAL